MRKAISTLLLMGCSLLLAACPSKTVTINSLCEARIVRVSPELKTEFKKWLTESGHLRADAPSGAGLFLKDLRVNNDLIRQRCGG